MQDFDVIIAGAGPAGTSAAAILGEYGYQVLLLDKENFPRDKTCGDGITYKALPALERLGIADKIISEDPFCTYGYTLIFRDFAKLCIENPPNTPPLAWIISRNVFDNTLLENACKYSTVRFKSGAKVTDFKTENGNISAIEINHKEWISARLFIDATGVNSILGQENKDPRNSAVAVRGYYSGVEGLNNTIEIYFSDTILPGYFWIFPTSKTTANIGGGTFQNIVEERKINIKDLLHDFIENHPIAKEKLKNAKLEGSLMGGRIPLAFGDFDWTRVKGNLLLTGDAGGFVNPLTAEGISYALNTGIFAADTIHNYLQSPNPNPELLKNYDKLWIKEFSSQYKMGDIYQQGMEPEMAKNYIIQKLMQSMQNHDLNNAAEAYEYMIKMKVLAKAF